MTFADGVGKNLFVVCSPSPPPLRVFNTLFVKLGDDLLQHPHQHLNGHQNCLRICNSSICISTEFSKVTSELRTKNSLIFKNMVALFLIPMHVNVP